MWALGVTLYVFLFGDLPFKASQHSTRTAQHKHSTSTAQHACAALLVSDWAQLMALWCHRSGLIRAAVLGWQPP
jgi:hypothetical protein